MKDEKTEDLFFLFILMSFNPTIRDADLFVFIKAACR